MITENGNRSHHAAYPHFLLLYSGFAFWIISVNQLYIASISWPHQTFTLWYIENWKSNSYNSNSASKRQWVLSLNKKGKACHEYKPRINNQRYSFFEVTHWRSQEKTISMPLQSLLHVFFCGHAPTGWLLSSNASRISLCMSTHRPTSSQLGTRRSRSHLPLPRYPKKKRKLFP